MKRNNKTKLFATLMLYQAILALAKEGIIVNQRDVQSGGSTTTYVGVDNTYDGRADFYIGLPYTNGMNLYALLKDELLPGVIVSYDDNAKFDEYRNMLLLHRKYIMAINGIDILDLFPAASAEFESAARKRAGAPRSELPRAPMAILPSKAVIASEALLMFFRRRRRITENEPTVKELEHDVKRLLKGEADGEIIIKNEQPRISGGAREVIDNVHTGKVAAKATEEIEVDDNSKRKR